MNSLLLVRSCCKWILNISLVNAKDINYSTTFISLHSFLNCDSLKPISTEEAQNTIYRPLRILFHHFYIVRKRLLMRHTPYTVFNLLNFIWGLQITILSVCVCVCVRACVTRHFNSCISRPIHTKVSLNMQKDDVIEFNFLNE
jgi:hypothetical protein